MTLFANKYRIESTRMTSWDYSINAAYFVTICTWNREQYFGNVIENEMNLSPLGISATNCWKAIPKHFPFVALDVYIVMPNHVHGIIIIDKDYSKNTSHLETQNLASPQQGNNFGPQSRNLASIIRGYKICERKFDAIQMATSLS